MQLLHVVHERLREEQRARRDQHYSSGCCWYTLASVWLTEICGEAVMTAMLSTICSSLVFTSQCEPSRDLDLPMTATSYEYSGSTNSSSTSAQRAINWVCLSFRERALCQRALWAGASSCGTWAALRPQQQRVKYSYYQPMHKRSFMPNTCCWYVYGHLSLQEQRCGNKCRRCRRRVETASRRSSAEVQSWEESDRQQFAQQRRSQGCRQAEEEGRQGGLLYTLNVVNEYYKQQQCKTTE